MQQIHYISEDLQLMIDEAIDNGIDIESKVKDYVDKIDKRINPKKTECNHWDITIYKRRSGKSRSFGNGYYELVECYHCKKRKIREAEYIMDGIGQTPELVEIISETEYQDNIKL